MAPKGQTLRAAIWMIGAIIAFSSMAVAGRAVASELDTFELMMYRSLIGFVLVVSFAAGLGKLGALRMDRLGTHAFRNLCHFTGQNLWFAALSMIPLAQVIALEFTSPVWVVLLAPLILREKLTPIRGIVAILGFIGVLIVARPNMSNLEPGVFFAALAAIAFAGSILTTKLLTQHHSITNILFWLTAMQFVFGLICAGWDFDVALPTLKTLPWVVVVAVAGLTAHLCLTTALSIAPATLVVPMDFLRLPTIAIIGMVFYAEALDFWIFLGAAIIFAANYLNVWAENRRATL